MRKLSVWILNIIKIFGESYYFRESKYLLKAYDYLHFNSKLRFRVELAQDMSWVAEHKFSVSWPQFKCMYENMWMVRQFLMTTKSFACSIHMKNKAIATKLHVDRISSNMGSCIKKIEEIK